MERHLVSRSLRRRRGLQIVLLKHNFSHTLFAIVLPAFTFRDSSLKHRETETKLPKSRMLRLDILS